MTSALSRAEERHAALERQHELLLETEHALRSKLRGVGAAVAAGGGGGGGDDDGDGGGGETTVGLEPEGEDSASITQQLAQLEMLSAGRAAQLDAADASCASLTAGLANARSEYEGVLGGCD